MHHNPPHSLRLPAFALLATMAIAAPAGAQETPCVDCLQVRVGPPVVARGPFPDELDATFTALRLADGSFRGFTANGLTYAVDGPSLSAMEGPRRPVLQVGEPGSLSDCGRWLTSALRLDGTVLGMVHQERACDYGQGRTNKSMAIATSSDEGLSWSEPQTVITGTDVPLPDRITGEGDCTMIDGADGYLYAYCLRNTDWQTIVARAPAQDPTDWHKFYNGAWDEPGLGGQATAIGFLGPGAAYVRQPGWVATVATDPWFGGVRLSLSADKVSFVDLKEPLLTIDGAQWERPADTDLIAYSTMLNPDTGSTTVDGQVVLSYIYVPPGKGFESRYLVQHPVSFTLEDQPVAVQVGMALARWTDADRRSYVTSSGPLTGDRRALQRDTVVAYMLTRAPEGQPSIKLTECTADRQGRVDQILAPEGSCAGSGYVPDRTAGWLYTAEQPGTVPVYLCAAPDARSHFASTAADCEGLGAVDTLLGYGLAS